MSSKTTVHTFDVEKFQDENTSRKLLKESELKNRIIQTVFDFIIICCNFFIFAMVYFLVSPRIAYFTCDQSDITYPYKSNTIDEWVVGLYGVLGGILVIILVELYNAFYINKSNDNLVSEKLKTFIVCALHGISLFILGISSTLMFTEIGKRWVGRLRPHFLSVCAPTYSAVSCYTSTATGYIYNSISTADPFCTGDASKVKEGRFSFPSGHSSFSTYCMTFIIIFLEARLILVRLRFIKTFIQIAAFIAAWVTMLSRVSDYWHRFTDVLAGFFLGLMVALFVVLVLGRVLWEYKIEKRIYDVDDLKEK